MMFAENYPLVRNLLNLAEILSDLVRWWDWSWWTQLTHSDVLERL